MEACLALLGISSYFASLYCRVYHAWSQTTVQYIPDVDTLYNACSTWILRCSPNHCSRGKDGSFAQQNSADDRRRLPLYLGPDPKSVCQCQESLHGLFGCRLACSHRLHITWSHHCDWSMRHTRGAMLCRQRFPSGHVWKTSILHKVPIGNCGHKLTLSFNGLCKF